MAAYIVTYDLYKQGQNYTCLTEKLEAYGTHWHMQQSVWIISTNETAAQIRDKLSPCLDSNDKLFVGKLSGEAAWVGYNQKITDWLKGTL
jgi:CRISPR/Cas system-associated endoribonuclease Cas2